MLIYRLEKDGIGPVYHPDFGTYRNPRSPLCNSINRVLEDHINPMESGPWFMRVESVLGEITARFGCPSVESLVKYWTKDLFNEILFHGFEVAVYEVPDHDVMYCKDSDQCAFSITKSQKAA